MADKLVKRKYCSFNLETEDCDTKFYYSYRDAFNAFHKAQGSATLYGVKQFGGEVVTIFSK